MRAPNLEGWRTPRVGICMAFKLRLQIFFVILTVVPLLVGGWMIQRTVIESRRSSIDQRLATGVGTLGAQYATISDSGRKALQRLASNQEFQQAILDKDAKSVQKLADAAAGGNVVFAVTDANGKPLTRKPLPGMTRIKSLPIISDNARRDGHGLCRRRAPDRSAAAVGQGRDARRGRRDEPRQPAAARRPAGAASARARARQPVRSQPAGCEVPVGRAPGRVVGRGGALSPAPARLVRRTPSSCASRSSWACC